MDERRVRRAALSTAASGAAGVVLAAALVLAAATEARARTTVTVQITYGAVVCGGAGLLIYYSGTFGLDSPAARAVPALVNIGEEGVRWGVPVPRTGLPGGEARTPAPVGAPPRLELPLVQWRF